MKTFALWATCGLLAACTPLEEKAPATGDGGQGGGQDAAARATDAGRPDGSAASVDARPETDAAPLSDAARPTDVGLPDPAPSDAMPPPPEEIAEGPIFGPDTPGAAEIDAPLAALVDAWRARPTDEASARAHAAARLEAIAAVQRGGAAAADRVASRCGRLDPRNADDRLVCLRLLGLVESRSSTQWLEEVALTRTPRRAIGLHLTDSPPEALARIAAHDALVDLVRAGSAGARSRLTSLVADPANPDRRLTVEAVYRALPTAHARALLRRSLPAGEAWRLYEIR